MSEIGRRDFLRRSAAGTIAVGSISYGAGRLGVSPVGKSQAIAPLVAAAGIGGSIAAGWLLRETEVIGADDTSTGLTPDALQTDIYDTAQTRKSTNASTIVDNKNILDGLKHTAYADGKIAAIEMLNDGQTQQTVEDAGVEAVNDYITTVLTNLLKTWNESCNEANNLITAAKDHSELNVHNVFNIPNGGDFNSAKIDVLTDNKSINLPDGSTMSVHELQTQTYLDNGNYSGTHTWSPANYSSTDGTYWVGPQLTPSLPPADSYSGDLWDNENIVYMDYNDWGSIYDRIKSTAQNVRDGLVLWVDKVYSEVQSGELDTSELLTPREQAQLTSSDEDFPQAIADLQALNISVDLEREAEVYLPNTNATISGNLGYSGDKQLSVGTVDPDATDDNGDPIYPGSFYFTYDISEGEGTWAEYNEGIDGGTLTFTAEPYKETDYTVSTSAGETVTVVAGDFTDEGDGTWTVDLSGDLDNVITNVEQIKFYAQTTETQYETIQLDQEFEIKGFTDSEGNEYQSSNFENSEPQTDDNYITEEQWKEQQQRNEELIEKYEESQNESQPVGLGGSSGGLIAAGAAVVAGWFVLGGG